MNTLWPPKEVLGNQGKMERPTAMKVEKAWIMVYNISLMMMMMMMMIDNC